MRQVQALIQRPDVRKILANTGWLFSDGAFRLVLTALVSAWVARYLGAQQYGQYNLALAYLILAAPVVRLGLDNVLVPRLVNAPEQAGQILGTAFFMRLLMALAMLSPLYLMVAALHPGDPTVLLLMTVMSLGMVFQALDVLNLWFQSQVASRHSVLTRNASFLFTSGLKVVAILLGAPLIIFGVLYLLYMVVSMLLLWLVYRRKPHRWTVDWGYARGLLREGLPLIVAGLAASVYTRIDQVMLGQMLLPGEAEAAVGVYSAAARLSEMWYFVPLAVVSSVVPSIIQSKLQSESLYRKRLQRLFNLMALISYAVCIPMTFLSGVVVELLFGSQYAASAPALAVLMWAGLWVNSGAVCSHVLVVERRNGFLMWAVVAGVGVNVLLNLALIPLFGILGAALATLAAQFATSHLATLLLPAVRFLGWMQARAILYPNPLKIAEPDRL
jgi:PST family polysaccharide transporter